MLVVAKGVRPRDARSDELEGREAVGGQDEAEARLGDEELKRSPDCHQLSTRDSLLSLKAG